MEQLQTPLGGRELDIFNKQKEGGQVERILYEKDGTVDRDESTRSLVSPIRNSNFSFNATGNHWRILSREVL